MWAACGALAWDGGGMVQGVVVQWLVGHMARLERSEEGLGVGRLATREEPLQEVLDEACLRVKAQWQGWPQVRESWSRRRPVSWHGALAAWPMAPCRSREGLPPVRGFRKCISHGTHTH